VEETRQPLRVTRSGKSLAEIHPVPVNAAEEERLRAERDARDIEMINRNAAKLKVDAEDGLRYQAFGSFDREKKASRPKNKKNKSRRR
jgi:hypothetical protein